MSLLRSVIQQLTHSFFSSRGLSQGSVRVASYEHRSHFESLELRHLMAAIPIARDDAAFYTNVGTDLVYPLHR